MVSAGMVAAALLAPAGAATAAIINTTWAGGAGNWTTAGQWSGGVVPNNNITDQYNVFIDGGDGTVSPVTFNTTAFIDSLTIDSDDSLAIGDGRQLFIVKDAGRPASGAIANAGTISLNAATSISDLVISGGDVTLSGSGTLVMGDHVNNRVIGNGGTDRLINEAGHTIRGGGLIGGNFSLLTNRGLIEADQATSLIIDPLLSGPNVNSGIMRAVSGRQLTLVIGIFNNFEGATDGLIRADNADLALGSATITGGNVDIVGTGTIFLSTSNILDANLTNSTSGTIRATGGTNLLSGVVNNVAGGQVIVDDGAQLTLLAGGSYTNDGTISLNAATSISDLIISGGDVTLSGSGTLVMGDHINNRILGNGAGARLINEAGHTIRGGGQFGGSSMLLTNRGLIEADQATNLGISLLGTTFENEGTLRASGTGGLAVFETLFANSGSVEAQAGSYVAMSGTYQQTAGLTVINGELFGTGVDIQGGRLGGSGVIRTGVLNSGGTVGAGNSPGVLTVEGGYTQLAAAALEVEIDGFLQGIEFDLLAITGLAALDGIVEVIADALFASTLSIGDQFEILTAEAGVSGAFSAINVNLVGLAFSQIIGANNVILEVTQADVVAPGVVPEPATWLVFVMGWR